MSFAWYQQANRFILPIFFGILLMFVAPSLAQAGGGSNGGFSLPGANGSGSGGDEGTPTSGAGSYTASSTWSTVTSGATWTVPSGVTEIKIKVWGAGGGGGHKHSASSEAETMYGGGGGYAEGVITVIPGQVLDIDVGAGGDGGTASGPTSGGGLSRVASGSVPWVIGGSGGGSEGDNDPAVPTRTGYGGPGGGTDGYGGKGGAALAVNGGAGGSAGTQTAGGAGGGTGDNPGSAGTQYTGGAGGDGYTTDGGGGGAGYYGGGGGDGGPNSDGGVGFAAGGGGGSSYVIPSASATSIRGGDTTSSSSAHTADTDFVPEAGFGGMGNVGSNGDDGRDGLVIIYYNAAIGDITIAATTNISPSTATFNGEIVSTGGESLFNRGFAYSTDPTFATGVSSTSESGSYGAGTYSLSVSNLALGTTYYVRAFAENSIGIGTSANESFSTTAVLPTIAVATTNAIATTTATFNGEIVSTGGESLFNRGFAYSTDPTFATGVSTSSEISGAYDISTATFDSIALSVSEQDTGPSAMLFNHDGTRLYVMGFSGDINAYTLSTPYDISSATFDSTAMSVSAQETSPSSMLFNNDGTVLYMMGWSGDDINTYTLTTAYDISTATFDSIALIVSAQESFPSAMLFNHDGTRLYVMGFSGDDINAYTLSTPYDISSASFDSIVLSVSARESYPTDMLFNNDGTVLYMMGWSSDDINTYTLSTAYDISTASFDSIALSVSAQEINPYSMLFNHDGTGLYVLGISGDDINAYTIPVVPFTTGTYTRDITGLTPDTTYYVRAFAENTAGIAYSTATDSFTTLTPLTVTASVTTNISLSTATFNGEIVATGGGSLITRGFAYSTDPTFATGVSTSSEISGAYDISTATFDSISLSVAGQEAIPNAMLFNNDGTVLYVMGTSGDDINAYTLSTPYNISTATFDSIVLDVSGQETFPTAMLFNHDGTVLYATGWYGDDINTYTLSTAYDISTATFDSIALSVSAQEAAPYALLFNHDGTVLYVMGTSGDDINAYTLSTPYDISTASFDSIALDVSGQETAPYAMLFNHDGTVLYVMGSSDDINTYTLSSAYDISTASFDNIALDVSGQETGPAAMLFNHDGTVLYVMGTTGDDINAYTIPVVPFTTGTYTRDITGLTPDITYYVRAFAENTAGIAYSTATTFSTIAEEVGFSTINNHSANQVSNAFNFQNQTNETLFAFNLNPTSGVAATTDITFTLSGARQINPADFSNLRLYIDNNSDAAYDGGDTQVGGTGVMALSGQSGSITFNTAFTLILAKDYILVADFNAPERGSSLTINLLRSGVISTDGNTQDIFGSVDRIQHSRNNRGGGGGASSVVGAVAPAAHGIVGGGGAGVSGDDSDTGGAIDTNIGGGLIGNNPNFKRPTANSGEWTNPASAYDGTDGTYATDSSGSTNNFSNYDFAIPGSNQIYGVAVQLEVSGTTAAGTIGIELSFDGGTTWTTSGTVTPTLTTTDVVVTMGGPANTWGRSWTPIEFSSANFAVRLTGNPSSNTVQVDGLQVRVYSVTTGGGGGGGGRI
jgi:uncharacterized protein YkuJ